MNVPSQDASAASRADARQRHRDLKLRLPRLSEEAIDLILREARSHYAWTDRPVPEELLREVFEIAIKGATSMNTLPARFVFVRTTEGKERLAKALKPANVAKMMGAPVTAIVAYDLDHWTHLPELFPHEDRRHLFESKPDYAEDTAYRNSTLQGAYLMVACRAVGLDVGAMSGFSNPIVDEMFFAGTRLKSNFLCNIGYADETALFQRLPRFDFDRICTIA